MRKSILRVVGLACLALAAEIALAQTPVAQQVVTNMSWTAPTTREDGTPYNHATDGAKTTVLYSNGVPVAGADGTVAATLPTGVTAVDVTGTTRNVTLSLYPRAEPYVLHFGVYVTAKDGSKSKAAMRQRTFVVNSTALPRQITDFTITITCQPAGACNIQTQ